MPQPPSKGLWDKVIDAWWGKVLVGCILVLFAWNLYGRLAQLESGERESVYIGRTTKLAYELGGKWGATGIMGAFGLGLIAWGGVQLVRKKE